MVMEQHDNLLDDAALVGAVRAGNRDAFTPLLLRYYASVLRLCERMLGTTADAYDVAQDAALHAFLGLDRLHEPARFGAWLHAIAANSARKALRRRHALSLDALDLPAYQINPWNQPTLEDVYAQRELQAALAAALHDLPAINRAAVIGFFLDGRSYAELAEQFNVPVSTVRGRLFQGRQHLKRALMPFYDAQKSLLNQPQEILMNTPTMIEMKLLGFCSAPFPRETLVLLRAVGTKRDVPLRLSRADTDALQEVYATLHLPNQPAVHNLTQQIMNTLQARLERITIHRLVDTAFYITLTFVHNGQQIDLDAPLGEALVLALRNGTPVYMAQPVLDALSIEIAPLIEQWQHHTTFRQEWKQRMRERVYESEAPPRRVRYVLTPEDEQRIMACLARVLQKVAAKFVLLVHQSGRLVAWHGDGDAEIIELFCGVRMVYEEDPRGIRDLLVYHTLLVGSVWQADGTATMQDVGDEWRLELGWAHQRLHDTWERDRKYLQLAARELEDLLPNVTVANKNHTAED